MISNIIKKIDEDIIEVPLLVRASQEGWVPDFDIWSTKISGDTSYIDCTQSFGAKLKHYATTDIDPRIGHFDGDNLIIYWKALIDSESIDVINSVYSGKLRATCWRERYCTYFATGSESPWLHTTILDNGNPGHVVHHIDYVSLDNRRQNLHILPKTEHDGISNPPLEERRLMFTDPQKYWQDRKKEAVERFIEELALIILFEQKAKFVAKFAKENLTLAKEILEAARFDISLRFVRNKPNTNRNLNQHLPADYLDAYEIEKYLKKFVPKPKTEGQVRWF